MAGAARDSLATLFPLLLVFLSANGVHMAYSGYQAMSRMTEMLYLIINDA